MGYMKIKNLYADQTILKFKRVWVTEKIHGTSAYLRYHGNDDPEKRRFDYHPGGASWGEFVKLFDEKDLLEKCYEIFGSNNVKLHGEHYGGKIQGMKDTYGEAHHFVLFDIRVGDSWLSFDKVLEIGAKLGLEVVWSKIIDCNLENLNKYRDQPSVQAKRNGIEGDQMSEGIVIHPLEEYTKNNGNRVITKHKGEHFREGKSKKSCDPIEYARRKKDKLRGVQIAMEYVTEMRLKHVLDAFYPHDISQTGDIIKAMMADIEAEEGEVIEISNVAKKEIAKMTAVMFKKYLHEQIKDARII